MEEYIICNNCKKKIKSNTYICIYCGFKNEIINTNNQKKQENISLSNYKIDSKNKNSIIYYLLYKIKNILIISIILIIIIYLINKYIIK